jgi:hypothetical protein
MLGSLHSKTVRSTPGTKPLLYLIYLQAISLAITYVAGIWLTITGQSISFYLPEVLEHGLASSVFVLLTGLVGFIAALQGQRKVSIYNFVLFLITVLTGSTGFALLGNPTDATQIGITNLSMLASVAIGMPITGFSLAKVSCISRGKARDLSPVAIMTYIALGALSLTMIAGVAVPSTPLYAFAVVTHVGFAALTVALVLGVLVVSILEGSEGSASNWEPQRVAYSLLGLASVSLAGGDGVIYLTSGDLSYLVVMAEVAVLVYAFLMIAIGAPYRLDTLARRRR